MRRIDTELAWVGSIEYVRIDEVRHVSTVFQQYFFVSQRRLICLCCGQWSQIELATSCDHVEVRLGKE